MKLTLFSREKAKSVCRLSAYLSFALILSYVEVLLPAGLFIPIPGFKLGLANIIVILCFFGESPSGAFIVSMARVLISALLFGTISSFAFSFFGAALSFISILVFSAILKDNLSFIGLSVISAVFHNVGQFICSLFYVGSLTAFSYLPALMISGLICGAVTGVILCALPRKVFFERNFGSTK